jgi:hypothetical protein
MSAPWTLARGATVLPDGGTRFAVWAPAAQRVDVSVSSGPRATAFPLAPAGGGLFTGQFISRLLFRFFKPTTYPNFIQ